MSNPPPNVLQLARQGDPEAIAALMNRHLEAQGITAHVAQQENRLRVSLEGVQIPHQADLVAYVKKGITGLELATVDHLTITGKQLGSDTQAWSEELVLNPLASEAAISTFDHIDAAPAPADALADLDVSLDSDGLANDLDFDLGLSESSDDFDLGLAEPGADLDFDLGFAEAAPADDLDFDLGFAEAPSPGLGDDLGADISLGEGAADLDFDLGLADSGQGSGADDLDFAFAESSAASDLDFDLGPGEASATDSLDLDFDLGEASSAVDLASGPEAAADFDLDLGMEADFPSDFAVPSDTEALDLGLGDESTGDDGLDLDFDLAEEPLAAPSADLAFDLEQEGSVAADNAPPAALDFDLDNLAEAGEFDSAAEISFDDLGAAPDLGAAEALGAVDDLAIADLGSDELGPDELGPDELSPDDFAGLDLDLGATPAPGDELGDLWDDTGSAPEAAGLEPLGGEAEDLWDSSDALPDALADFEPEPEGAAAAEAIALDTGDLDVAGLESFSFDNDVAALDLTPELGEFPPEDLGAEDLGAEDLGGGDFAFEDLGAAAEPADLEGWPLEEPGTLGEAGEADGFPGEPFSEELGLEGLEAVEAGEGLPWETAIAPEAAEFAAEADFAAPESSPADLYSPAPWEAEAEPEAVAADQFDLAAAAAPWAEEEDGADAAIADLGEAADGEFDAGFVFDAEESAFEVAPNPFEAEAWPPGDEPSSTIDTLELEPEPTGPESWMTSAAADLPFSEAEAEADYADLALEDEGWAPPDQPEAPLPPEAELAPELGFGDDGFEQPVFAGDEPEEADWAEGAVASEAWAAESFEGDDLGSLPEDDFGAAAAAAEPFGTDEDFAIDDFGASDFEAVGLAAEELPPADFAPVVADTDSFEDDISSSNGFIQDLNGAAPDNGELAAADDFIQEFGADPSTHVSLRADQFNDDGSVRQARGSGLPMKLILGLGLGALVLALAGLLLNGLLGRLRAPSGDGPVVTEPVPPTPAPPPVAPGSVAEADLFRQAVNAAQNAANLAQTASTSAQWQEVADSWAAAIDLMKRVPQADPNYAVAQQKAVEYQPNFDYAQQNAERLR